MAEIITKKQFLYRGKSLEELQAMEVREFAKLLKSRRKRNVLRQFQKIEDFINRAKIKLSKNKPIKTHQRDLTIVPQMIGMRIGTYNGREFVPVDVVAEMLGHVLGEFSNTRSKVKHGAAGVGSTKGTKSQSKH
ncbi:MAG TPA: ribosomal protein S19 family protein [Candidatus Nanoarchaeia archaeon]|nr:30S ribosomal protein S19, small subunit ribosomal protein S19 [uncultured archaeon]HJX49977.1 ribosomal protein S19 family protein [Candidatus Nanoarchaeia archaeon]